MKEKLELLGFIDLPELIKKLKNIQFRGVFDSKGIQAEPYKYAKFSLAKVMPSKEIGGQPLIQTKNKRHILFSPQPTIYLNQLAIIKTVDNFLKTHKKRVHKLNGAVEYDWKGRGRFHMIPPIVEKHTVHINNGYIDLKKLLKKFDSLYVKDAMSGMHKVSERYLKSFYIDEVSSIREMDVLHSNSHLLNYGLKHNGPVDFYIICDGSHRVDYAMETLNEPIDVILVESDKKPLVPYYAFPVPFYPNLRLSSKQAEKMYPRLERDKIHLFNDYLKKVLHYDWSRSKLSISKLRSNQ